MPQLSGVSSITLFLSNSEMIISATWLAVFPLSVANLFNKSLSFILISLPGTPPVGFCFCKSTNKIYITKNKTFESFICSRWTLVIQIKSTNFVAPHNLTTSLSVTAYQPPALLHCVGGYLFNHVFQIHNRPIGRNPPRHNLTGNVPVPGKTPRRCLLIIESDFNASAQFANLFVAVTIESTF